MSTVDVELDPFSVAILNFVAKLDALGAAEWNLYIVALVTTSFLYVIKLTCGKKAGIDWLAFIHALITGVGGILCVWLDWFAAETLTGLPGTSKREIRRGFVFFESNTNESSRL